MLRRMLKKIVRVFAAPQAHHRKVQQPPAATEGPRNTPLSDSLTANLDQIRVEMGSPDDLGIREFLIANKFRAALVWIDGLVDRAPAHISILHPLMMELAETDLARRLTPANVLEKIRESVITVAEFRQPAEDFPRLTEALLEGSIVLLVDGQRQAFTLDLRGWEKRAIEQPDTETVIRGPREGFVESLRTNTALLRRRIKSPDLRLEPFTIGRLTQTRVVLAYIKGTANDEIVKEARRRLSRIDTDGILESGMLEEFIEDSPFSPFPTLHATERPDVLAAALLEGRIGFLTDGTPFTLVAPSLFMDFLVSPEDYYTRVQVVVLYRLLRFVSGFSTVTLPSIYVVLVTFHQEMIPTSLALSVAAGREGTPFPAIFEALLMQTIFEILREAGARLPRQLGQAISIVGALVIGQAAVTAGLISPLMIIIIALTGIGSFVVPVHAMVLAFRLLSFPMLLFAGLFGFYGMTFALTLLLAHLVSLRSFGVPYMSPFAPTVVPDLKDTLTRLHWWWLDTRPWYMAQRNLRRQRPGQKPRPPEKAHGGPRDPNVRGESK